MRVNPCTHKQYCNNNNTKTAKIKVLGYMERKFGDVCAAIREDVNGSILLMVKVFTQRLWLNCFDPVWKYYEDTLDLQSHAFKNIMSILDGFSNVNILLQQYDLGIGFNDLFAIISSGEKTSAVSSTRKTEMHASVGSGQLLPPKALGRRGDLIFIKGSLELGCGDLDRYDSTSKSVYSSGMQLGLVQPSICSIGLTLQMMVMNCPFGNVCRIRRMPRFEYPQSINAFQDAVITIYEMILVAKRL
ncbi:hypothetical protein BDA99DRAFT_531927 [Phascolomyces articulosus]|uniref:Uncharacterized protein n=1 Tax=Phascolomyces articulosus TaxID=60185 RepID=A0AAD5PJ40_9FUNG|nr:hypothetical protein BDA99DRAFT_531927 [Phascolomyces articulosus]